MGLRKIATFFLLLGALIIVGHDIVPHHHHSIITHFLHSSSSSIEHDSDFVDCCKNDRIPGNEESQIEESSIRESSECKACHFSANRVLKKQNKISVFLCGIKLYFFYRKQFNADKIVFPLTVPVISLFLNTTFGLRAPPVL
ncbi:MAG: hypothetical protein ACEPOW_13065 [Bacteroidales bacterium]